ncbi:DMT family transporter [Alkalibacillus aidingensis]|uniref:DMT family transporter n=1 Tax=Alkalibacillus aidingensis TaxID=2747607 RepID=UPI001660BB33|nr:multidrug efflux SMR transporter [Alkalibacillus aidingensis]
MGWVFIACAAIFEMVGVVGLKLFSQVKKLIHGVLFFGGFALSFLFLYQSFNFVQISIAYAVWVGLGTAGAVVINMIFFDEPRSINRIMSVILIVIGVTGLKLVS